MEKVGELRSQLRAYRNASADEQTRADCFRADRELELFESYLRTTLDRRETHLLMARHHNSSSHPVLYDPQLPQLFVNNEPALRLFLRDIRYRVNKTALHKCLLDQGCTDFEIVSVKTKKSGSVATVLCNSLASSGAMQVKSCKKELVFTDPNGKQSHIKTKPDQFITQNALLPAQAIKRKTSILPDNLTRLFNQSDPVLTLWNYLSADDIFNLYIACHENSIFHRLGIPFDSSSIRYSGPNGLNQMLEDATTFTFRSISFSSNANVFETPFVNKFFKACANRCKNSTRRVGKHLVDLSAVAITRETIKILADHFAVHKLVLGKTPGGSEENLELEKLSTLSLYNNLHLSLKFLTKDCFSYLRTLRMVGCNEVPMDKLFSFVICNQRLEELVFTDSQSRNQHTVDLSVAAISGSNVLEKFQFNYSAAKTFRTHLIPDLIWNESKSIKSIDLENNTFFQKHANTLLSKLPNVQHVNILGLDIDQVLVLSSCEQILSIKINYEENLVSTLYSLIPTRVKSIEIVNLLGKKKTKAMDMFCIRDLFHSRDQLYIKLTNCKIAIPNNLVNYFAANHVQITRTSNTCEISKTPKET
ncbi:uncharacterized protein LOC107981724 [Nasonia vitripennis]|uniref:Uncharacterized protein n=1 Tax=Nasonia vitripennis TaxID=7425 RepID=A0A7M7PUU0_NASVI|nr:uncharacterized protein LOC107981724 [Nasonia vitripennis]XP_031777369.1 uncharacterized protein LOC107981724 [Nasonia vitripennis]